MFCYGISFSGYLKVTCVGKLRTHRAVFGQNPAVRSRLHMPLTQIEYKTDIQVPLCLKLQKSAADVCGFGRESSLISVHL